MNKEFMEDLKKKLVCVDPQKLVESLFEIAENDEIAMSKIARLISNEKENIQRFKEKLKNIKYRRSHYFSWKEMDKFSYELCELLNNLKGKNIAAEDGFKLICAFYEADMRIFEQADDSNGNIGDVFRYDALILFEEFALNHPDRKYVLNKIVELMSENDYGARDEIIKNVNKFLSKEEMVELFSVFEKKLNDGSKKSNWEILEIAKQMQDAGLYEKLVYQIYKEPNSRLLIEIAEVYFNCENVDKSQEILNLVPENDSFSSYEKENLQKRIFRKTENKEALYNLIYKTFKNRFSKSSLEELVSVAGEEKRSQLIQEALNSIELDKEWNIYNADFLTVAGDSKFLDNYVLKHYDKINGDYYSNILELIHFLDLNSKHLSSSLLYRALIDSILKRAKSKYYHHGIKYLKNLDTISSKISSWANFESHSTYLKNLKSQHKLKRSFWEQYNK